MARLSQWRLCTLSATLIVLLRAGWIAVMTVVLQNGSARQLTPRELAELNGEAPAHSGRQSRPGHDRRRKSLTHGASRPSGSTPAMRRGRAAASPPTGVPLQTFQRGWFEQWIKEGKGAIKWTRLSCRTFAANAVRLQLHALAYNVGNFMRTLAMPKTTETWSLTSLREKLIKIGLWAILIETSVSISRSKALLSFSGKSCVLMSGSKHTRSSCFAAISRSIQLRIGVRPSDTS